MLLTKDEKYELYEYENEKELEQMVKEHIREIFGENIIYIPKNKIESEYKIGVTPDGFLIDASNQSFYVIEVEKSEHDFYNHIHPQISRIKSALKNEATKNSIANQIYNELNTEDKKKIKILTNIEDVHQLIHNIVHSDYEIVVVIDRDQGLEQLKDEQSDIKVIEFETYKRGNKHIHRFDSFEPLFTQYDNVLREYGPRQIGRYWKNLSDAKKEKFRKYCCQKCDITPEEWDDMGWEKFLNLYREKTN